MNFAILLAAGIGSRFGKAVLKQRARLAGRPVFEHTLERLQGFDAIAGILVVTNEDMLAERAAIKAKFPKVLDVIKGGASRLESSYTGLRYLAPIAEPGAKVIIHDAVRPFVDAAISDGPEKVGERVAAALTGTLLGIFAAYGFVNPLANRVKFNNASELLCFRCIMQAVAGFAKGLAPLTAVEIARRSLDSSVQPDATELEAALKALPAVK